MPTPITNVRLLNASPPPRPPLAAKVGWLASKLAERWRAVSGRAAFVTWRERLFHRPGIDPEGEPGDQDPDRGADHQLPGGCEARLAERVAEEDDVGGY